jgi:hypothetical protein
MTASAKAPLDCTPAAEISTVLISAPPVEPPAFMTTLATTTAFPGRSSGCLPSVLRQRRPKQQHVQLGSLHLGSLFRNRQSAAIHSMSTMTKPSMTPIKGPRAPSGLEGGEGGGEGGGGEGGGGDGGGEGGGDGGGEGGGGKGGAPITSRDA